MLGLSVGAFTTLHVLISLVAILAGLAVVAEMLRSRFPAALTGVFLATTVATSATGFLFHSKSIGPPHVVGAISLVVLAVALFAIYVRKLAGPWRRVYVGAAVLALYLNAFVGVVQAFAKLAPLKSLAPTQTEPPFLVAQVAVLLLFVVLGVLSATRPRPLLAV